MKKSIGAVVLALLMCVLFVLSACTDPAGPPATTGNGGTTMSGAPTTSAPPSVQATLTTESPYVLEGSRVVFTAGGVSGGSWTFTYADAEADRVTQMVPDGASCALCLNGTGSFTLTARNGEYEASCSVTVVPAENEVPVSDPMIYWHGRTRQTDSGMDINNTAAGFEVRFYGKELRMQMTCTATAIYSILVDGETDTEKQLLNLATDKDSDGSYTLASFAEAGIHTVKILKRTEESVARTCLTGLTVIEGGLLPVETEYDLKIEIYGDSITCGYGNMRPAGEADAQKAETQNGLGTYATLVARELGAEYRVFAESGLGLYTNPYGTPYWLKDIYGNTSVRDTTPYPADAYVPDIIIINIGTNDCWAGNGSAGGNEPFRAEDYRTAYVAFVRGLMERYEGHDVTFFLCSGLMENVLAPTLSSIAEELTAEEHAVYSVEFARTTANGHPLYAEHQKAAERLMDVIGPYLDGLI